MCHANIYQKIAGIHILISEDVNIRRRNIINHKDNSHNDKGLVLQEYIIFIVYAPT